MITIAYLIVISLLAAITAFIDTFIHHYSFLGAMIQLYLTRSSASRPYIELIFFIGLIWAFCTDIRRKKNNAAAKAAKKQG